MPAYDEAVLPEPEMGESRKALAETSEHLVRAEGQLDRLIGMLRPVSTGEGMSGSDTTALRIPTETELGGIARDLAARADALVDRINWLCSVIRI